MTQQINIRFENLVGGDSNDYLAFGERYRVVSAYIVDNAGIATHAADFRTFTIVGSDDATAIFKWSTETSKEGALTAATPALLVDQSRSDLAVFEAGAKIHFSSIKSGSGKVAEGNVIIQLEQARKV